MTSNSAFLTTELTVSQTHCFIPSYTKQQLHQQMHCLLTDFIGRLDRSNLLVAAGTKYLYQTSFISASSLQQTQQRDRLVAAFNVHALNTFSVTQHTISI